MSANPQSVDLAYPIALSSYDVAQKRLEIVDRRLQELLGFTATITLGAIAAFSGKGFHFKSWLFMVAMVAGLFGLAIGTYARLHGFIVLIKPSVLDKKYLTLPESQFKEYFVHFAGKHWEQNAGLIRKKGSWTNATVLCFAVEIILLVLWAAEEARI